MDIAFAINAYATDARDNFKYIKSVLQSIVDKYGMGKVKYSLIVYGAEPSIKINFNEDFNTDENLKR